MTSENKICCNNCGREFIVENDILKEDVYCGRKQWGYFSKKDLEMHSFYLCEECYDEITSRFKIPVEKNQMNEAL